jgi:hypothetical protein
MSLAIHKKLRKRARLTKRWYRLKPIPEQIRLLKSKARFKVVAAGRRSGKSERAKRFLVREALSGHSKFDKPMYFAAAPTYLQAKRIYWQDFLDFIPKKYIKKKSESELWIRLINGAEIHVVSLDKPERIEGSPWDGGIITETGNIKPSAWSEHVRPALSDRKGWCWLEGVPEGRNHYYEYFLRGQSDEYSDWESFHWLSSEVLDEDEIEAAKRELDELVYAQEYEAAFVTFKGRAYYGFDANNIRQVRQYYNPKFDLVFCFDFNISPGVAAVVQEMDAGTCVIGEVHIPRNSTTPAVCRRLIKDWGDHEGRVLVYGDATGGAGGTASVKGSDWDLVRELLTAKFSNIAFRVPAGNPRQRVRINAVNSRSKNAIGERRLFVDPITAKHVVDDLEGVQVLEGGAGEIDKKAAERAGLSHISDALGYYIHYEFPIIKRGTLSPSGKVIMANR